MPPTNMNQNPHQPHAREKRPTANGDHHQGHGLTAPPPQLHHAFYPRSSSSSASFKGCCCYLFLLFSFLALLVLAVVLIIVLAVKPKKPQFDLQQVGVQYMRIWTSNPSSFDGTATAVTTTPTTASLSLTIHMLFTAVNPNKVGIKYGESRITVMYCGIPLGKASVPGFYQEAHSIRNVEATIAIDRANLIVLGDVGAKIRVLDFDSPGVQVSVDCAIVISPRKQSLTYKQCGFDGLSV
ncbi:hypothetical protein CRYUN_Cryun18bG0128900 [Craigia yunnanensis]